ncbi:MAG TPA: response regulator [Limnochordales bacterium]
MFGGTAGPARLVLADDDPAVRCAVRMFIEWHCPEFVIVGEAGDGQTVLELVEAHDPDVVLMDVRMPIMDGLTATRILKTDLQHRAAVVLMTSLCLQQLEQEAKTAGAAAVLSKPFPLPALRAALQACGGRSGESPAGAG